MHLDSTPLPVAESTVLFAIGDQRSSGAVSACLELSDSTAEKAALAALGINTKSTAAGASSLGTIAKFSSALLSPRVRRFMLQAGARSLLPDERVSHCLRTPTGAAVKVLYSANFRAGHLGGLQTCGSCWSCPVCQPKITEKRAIELGEGVRTWQDRGGLVLLVTFTLQHTACDTLLGLLDDLMKASYALRGGRFWMDFKRSYGIAGTVRALENTAGRFGFHPHMHTLFFVEGGADVGRFTTQLRDRWDAVVAKVGRYASPRWGLDVRSANSEIATYVSKFGKDQFWTVARELAKGSSKNAYGSGRSMNELLEAYVVEGDQHAGERWREYAKVFKGRKQLVWSRGLRSLLRLSVDEKSDEVLASEQLEDAVELAQLDLAAWRIVLANDARGELCDVASSGDRSLVRSFLLSIGVAEKSISARPDT